MQKNIKVLLLVFILLSGFACRKNPANDYNCNGTVCPALSILRPVLKFNITDKTTNQDLFFGTSRQYDLKDLVVFKKQNAIDTVHLSYYIDSINIPHHFEIDAMTDSNTFFIQIQNQKVDTIEALSRPIFMNCCLSGFKFDPVRLNGTVVCALCSYSTIVNIKK